MDKQQQMALEYNYLKFENITFEVSSITWIGVIVILFLLNFNIAGWIVLFLFITDSYLCVQKLVKREKRLGLYIR